MAGRIWNREIELHRLLKKRLKQHVEPRFGYGLPPEWDEAQPRRKWQHLGQFETCAAATSLASRHAGATVEPVVRFRGKRKPHQRLIGYRVGISTRLGAPFRQPVMTWALEEKIWVHRHTEAKKWLDRGRLKGGVQPFTRVSRRRWRRAGRRICRLALIGEVDRAETLDPQPQRLGVMWLIW